jgi:hypothetical protein
MAITAATNAHDAVVQDDGNLKSFIESAFPFLSALSTFIQGDLIALDTTNHIINRVAADTDGATILGVAPASVTAGVLVGPYPTGMGTIANQKAQAVQGPLYGGVFGLKVNAGDALVPGCKLYLKDGADSQTVSVTDSATTGNYVGIYMGPAVAAAVAGVFYPVKVGMRLSTTQTLQF